MRDELPFYIGGVCHPPGAQCGLLEVPILRLKCRFGVFGRWIVVLVDFNSLVPEILEFVSQLANVCNMITTSSPELIDFAEHSSRLLILMQIESTMTLTQKWHCGGKFHCKVKLDNVELTAIVDFGDAHDVTPLVLSVDNPLILANDKHMLQMPLIVLRPFCPYFITRVEESGLGGADSANACKERLPFHVKMRPSPNGWYGTYKFLP